MDPKIAKALGSPVRLEILTSIGTSTLSPNQLSQLKELAHLGLSKVSYHVKVLHNAGILKLVREESRRGAIEHFYQVVPASYSSEISRRKVPASARSHVSAPLMQKIIDAGLSALTSGTLDLHDESHLSCLPVTLDPRGCKEVSAALDQALKKITTAHERSSTRIAARGGPAIDATVIVASFESGAPDEP